MEKDGADKYGSAGTERGEGAGGERGEEGIGAVSLSTCCTGGRRTGGEEEEKEEAVEEGKTGHDGGLEVSGGPTCGIREEDVMDRE